MTDLAQVLADLRTRGFKDLLPQHGKRPCRQGPWASYLGLSPAEQERMFAEYWPCDVAVVTGPRSGILCIDIDTHDGTDFRAAFAEVEPELQRAIAGTLCERTPSGGLHAFFECSSPLVSRRVSAHVELKAAQGPGTDKVNLYRTWTNPSRSIARLPLGWMCRQGVLSSAPAQRAAPLSPAQQERLASMTDEQVAQATQRARNYAARIVAISGQGGHNATFSAACAIVARSPTEDAAWAVLEEWNESNAQPPWSEDDLRHKLDSALQTETLGQTLLAPHPELKDFVDGLRRKYSRR